METLDSRIENIKRRLKVLSKGLLETEDSHGDSVADRLFAFKVLFLHRTVKDYHQSPDAQSILPFWLMTISMPIGNIANLSVFWLNDTQGISFLYWRNLELCLPIISPPCFKNG